MTQSKFIGDCNLKIAFFLTINGVLVLCSNGAFAQSKIVPDNTLGAENSIVTPNIPINNLPSEQISGGAIRGTNLFHSFQEFNVGEGRGAYFTNPLGIENILSRVTGGNASEILGQLGVLGGNANLFLINPNGIIFGSNSSLDVEGSFLASTADSLVFDNGFQFSTTNPQTPPLLIVNTPIGLQFGESVGSITITNRSSSPLFVKSPNTLALVGGNITFQGGNLFAERIELGSVSSNSQVALQPIQAGWFLNYEQVKNFQDIQFIFGSFLAGVDIQLQGRSALLTDGSQIDASRTMTVNASEIVELVGTAPLSNTGFSPPSGLISQAIADEDGGDINIQTRRLIVRDGGEISTGVGGILQDGIIIPASGQGGNITVNASESVELIGDGSGLLTGTQGFGKAGNLSINTRNLIVRDGAQISAESSGKNALEQPLATGAAGNINITANYLLLNQGRISAETIGNPEQEGANINLSISDLLLLENESLISATALGNANGGNINIDTKFLIALPIAGTNGNDIIANAVEGRGGNIQINTQGIFNIAERRADENNGTNDIDASSDSGIDGVVEINDPNVDPQQTLEELPENVVDVSRLVAQNLCRASRGSQFTITGRGGLPDSPNEALSADETWEDWRIAVQNSGVSLQESEDYEKPSNQPQKIVEAQGWVRNSQGKIILTAEPIVINPHAPVLTSSGC